MNLNKSPSAMSLHKVKAVKAEIHEQVGQEGSPQAKKGNIEPDLSAADMMRIYKTTGVIEHGFHVLKSDLGLAPIFHRKPGRIEVHFTFILWGLMALAVLKAMLARRDLDYSSEQLHAKIKEGKVSIGDYIYPDAKSFRIQKALKKKK